MVIFDYFLSLFTPPGKRMSFLFLFVGGIPVFFVACTFAYIMNLGEQSERAWPLGTVTIVVFFVLTDLISRWYFKRAVGLAFIPLWILAVSMLLLVGWRHARTDTEAYIWLSSCIASLLMLTPADYWMSYRRNKKMKQKIPYKD